MLESYFYNLQWLQAGIWLLATLCITGICLWDDLKNISSRLRFAVHAGTAVVAGASFYALAVLNNPALYSILCPLILALALWFVMTLSAINFFNFADGINGYVAMIGIVSMVGLCAMIGVMDPQHRILSGTALLLWPMIAGILTFLRNNVILKRVFMGDCASTTLGFIVGINGSFAFAGWVQFAAAAACRNEPSAGSDGAYGGCPYLVSVHKSLIFKL